ncbi:conserved hypothetical protein [Theileria equi strain WA]|uniref:Uncharacterized protein n=1 Tax=Theileria equi strain WA TaxID=1537102 RepID=L1LBZ8_THEEQ|nr:conserved hypothetical protein [Theileria equi strain WA]EKX72861.1 conserved hypothetical protein [Theileria equi strain WA]|eukprot:XP_004832313.1 conserved hypothetical protein [Theileria equi strain WA]
MCIYDIFSSNGEVEGEKRLLYLGDLVAIFNDLGNGSRKFSAVLEGTASSLSALLDDVKISKEVYKGNHPNELEYEGEYLECIEKWEKIVEALEEMSIKLEGFSESILNKHVPEIEACVESIEQREEIPTHIGQTRMTPDEFMQVLRYFPVPDTERKMKELKLRKNLIYAHSEFKCAKKSLEDLEMLDVGEGMSSLLTKANNRINLTRRLLATAIEELANKDAVYKAFLTEYIVALNSPLTEEHKSSEYKKKFHALTLPETQMARVNERSSNMKKQEYEKFKNCTEILGYITDDFTNTVSNC